MDDWSFEALAEKEAREQEIASGVRRFFTETPFSEALKIVFKWGGAWLLFVFAVWVVVAMIAVFFAALGGSY